MNKRRVHVPTVLQIEAVECGAACLGMVLGYWGCHVPLEEIRIKAAVTRDGSNAAKMLEAARAYGLEAAAFRREPGELGELGFPQILFWEFNHFVVLEGIRGNRFFINDPAVGRRELSADEFGHAFTGITMAFEPGENFRRQGRRSSVAAYLLREVGKSRKAFAYLVLLSLLLVIPGIAVPGFGRIFVDYYLVENFRSWLIPLLAGMAATAIVRAILTTMQARMLTLLQTKLALSMSADFFWRVLRLPLRFFEQRDPAEVASRIRLANTLANTITGPLASASLSILTSACYGAIMLFYNWQLALTAIALALLSLALLYRFNQSLGDLSRRHQLAEGKAYAAGVRGLDMLNVYRATGSEHLLFQRWMSPEIDTLNAEQKLERRYRLVRLAPQILEGFMALVILALGAYQVMKGTMTLGELVGFQMLAGMFAQPVSQLAALGGELQQASGSILRIDDLRRYPLAGTFATAKSDAPPPELPHPGIVRRIEAENIHFGYSPDAPLFEGLSLRIEPGSQIAIVGGSGSGKSTLGKILLGIIEPWSGTVRYDGVAVGDLPWQSRRGLVSYVEQTPGMFSGSIRDNITFWDRSGDDRGLNDAAHAAMIHDIIAARPAGYETRLVGTRGFSGGEIQRIAIARALYGNPSLVVLDEATSALDTLTEKAILTNLRQLGITCVLITHRLSAIRHCDHIVVLEGGRIIEQGRHGDLLRRNGPYRRLMEGA